MPKAIDYQTEFVPLEKTLEIIVNISNRKFISCFPSYLLFDPKYYSTVRVIPLFRWSLRPNPKWKRYRNYLNLVVYISKLLLWYAIQKSKWSIAIAKILIQRH